MFNLNYEGPLILSETVFNYDISDMYYMIQESEQSIKKSLLNYDACRASLLTENASSKDLMMFTEAATTSLKDKFIKIIVGLKDFISARLREIAATMMTFLRNNTAFMEKIEESIKQRLAHGDYKHGPIMKMYKYTLDAVNISKPDKFLKSTFSIGDCDFTLNTSDITPANMTRIKESVAGCNRINDIHGAVKRRVIAKAIESSSIRETSLIGYTPAMYDQLIYMILRGTAIITKAPDKFPVKFDGNILNETKRGKDIEDYLKGSFNIILNELDQVRKETEAALKSETGTVVHPVGGIKHTDVFGPLHQYFSKKLSIVNAVIHTVTMLNMKKLQASVSYINDCKKLCMMAYTYKTELKIIPKSLRLPQQAMPSNA